MCVWISSSLVVSRRWLWWTVLGMRLCGRCEREIGLLLTCLVSLRSSFHAFEESSSQREGQWPSWCRRSVFFDSDFWTDQLRLRHCITGKNACPQSDSKLTTTFHLLWKVFILYLNAFRDYVSATFCLYIFDCQIGDTTSHILISTGVFIHSFIFDNLFKQIIICDRLYKMCKVTLQSWSSNWTGFSFRVV
jgi:hypothetical protein